MKHTTRAVRRIAASVTFATVAGGLALPLLASPAAAVQDTATRRLEGTDRYGTAAAVAADTFADGAESVVLATGEVFADALAANGLAGALDAPVLLTLSDRLPQVTVDALEDLGPTTVYVMGGTAAVSQAVEDTLGDYEVVRVEGENRFETAAAAGDAIAATDDSNPTTTDDGLGSTSDGVTALLANGFNFPDAVSGGGVAFAGRLPVLLTAADELPDATVQALEDLGIEHVLVLGGTAAVSSDVEAALDDLGYGTERLAGADRWATNAAVNDYAGEELDFGGATAYLSTGSKFADALTGGPAAGANAAPLVLTATDSLPGPTREYLETHAGAIDEIVAIGGTAAIAASTLQAAAAATKLDTNQTLTVAPADSAALPISGNFLANDGAREFTASDLEPGTDYVIALLDAETVVTSGGNAGFTSYSLSDEAGTSIESVNGTPTGAAGGAETQQETGTAADGGTLTFVIDAAEADQVIPVVYEDVDGDEELTLVGQIPDEPFGIGGRTAWGPPEAADDTYDNVLVTFVSTQDNYFVAEGSTFPYDTTDRFRSNGTAITPAQFEGMLTAGDELDITYFQDQQSLFDVVLDTIPDITNMTASTPSASNPNLVQVSWTASPQPDVVYTVYRDNGDGVLNLGPGSPDVEVSAKGASTSRQFVEPAGTGPVRYAILAQGGTSGTGDGANNDGDPMTFLTNEIVPGVTFFGLTDGTTVSTNTGLNLVNAGDEWMLHFSKDVQVASNASITVGSGSSSVTLTNGTSSSTWTVSGRSVTITLGLGANAAPDISYGASAVVSGLTGVRDLGGTTITATGLRDTVLENDGPELMVESTTCDPGESQCTIAFNEPVDPTSAQQRLSYGYTPDGFNNLNTITLGADARTITLGFATGLGGADELSPAGPPGAVEDDNEQASTQGAFDFVR